jgi:two-component system, NarL family, sensor kinase
VVVAREEERRRLRRDLHDEVGPTLAGLSMQLGVVRTLVATQPEAAAERVGLLQDAARTALGTLRRVAHDLRPPALDELGLVGALRRLADTLGLQLTVSGTAPPALPAAVEVAAYRIGAEALHNVVRHAGVAAAELAVDGVGGDLVLVVRDAGAGRAPHAPTGVGLLAMRERADELGGAVEVASAPGGGTVVTARLPAELGVRAEVGG